MNVIEIIADRLRLIGADGLCRDGCGCSINDLIPCESDPSFCVPAKGRAILPEEEDYDEVRFGVFYEPLSLPNPKADVAPASGAHVQRVVGPPRSIGEKP